MDNYGYQDLLNMKVNKFIVPFIFISLFLIFILYGYTNNVYSTYTVKGLVVDDKLQIILPVEYSDTIHRAEFILIENKNYTFNIYNIEELFQEGVYYYIYTIDFKNSFLDKEVLEISIYYDYEKILSKILNSLF